MKFMCLVWSEPGTFDHLTPVTDAVLTDATIETDYALRERGQLIMTQALADPEEAVTVKMRDGKVTMHDGPFVETKEWIGGVIIIEARDMDEAVAIAGQYPAARVGSIEIRPAKEQFHSKTGQGRPAPAPARPKS